jgi:MFS family permease
MSQKIFTRDFVLCFSSQFTSVSVISVLLPTLPIYLSTLGANKAEIGLLIGVFSVTSLVFRPFVGRMLLRVPEKRFMMMGTLIYLTSSLAYLFAKPFFPFFIVRAFHGAGLACFSTAVFTRVANDAPEAHRGQTLTYFLLSFNLGWAVAPAIGMFCLNRFGFTALFLGCAGLSLCTFLVTLRLGKTQGISSEERLTKMGVFLNREALSSSIISFVSNFLWGAVAAFFPLYAVGHRVDNPGFFYAAYAITVMLIRGMGGKILDVYAREKVILPCFATQTAAMIILVFSTTLPMFILAAALWGIGNSYLIPILILYAVDRADRSQRGPAMGTYTAFSDLGMSLGPVIMGIILQLSSYRVMFIFLAFSGVINFAYFYFSIYRKEKRRQASL